MRMNGIQTQTERKRQDRSAHRDEKRRCRTRTLRVQGPIRPAPGVCATKDTAQGEKCLFNRQNQAILTSHGTPLGEIRFEPIATPGDAVRLVCAHKLASGSADPARQTLSSN